MVMFVVPFHGLDVQERNRINGTQGRRWPALEILIQSV
jgi:hypothetical protein